MSVQRFIHWLEEGGGGVLLRVVGTVLLVIVLSAILSVKRYNGPNHEGDFIQSLMAKSIASGEGFTIPVLYPQDVSFQLEHTGEPFDAKAPMPELRHAPLYPLILSAVYKIMPEDMLWQAAQPRYYTADFVFLGVDLVFFWLSCLTIWVLARKVFSKVSGRLALAGLLLSVGAWRHVLEVPGGSLLMFELLLLVMLFHSLLVVMESHPNKLGPIVIRAVLLGLVGGCLFLSEYSAGLVMFPVLAGLILFCKGKVRWVSILLVSLTLAIVVTPWIVRNVEVSGSPIGLAWQNLFMRAGDSTAEPAVIRNTWDAMEHFSYSLRKITNKGLDQIKLNLSERLWSSGALFFAAFAVAGSLYRFQNQTKENVRRLCFLILAVLFLIEPFLKSGESERLGAIFGMPLIILLGAGFFPVLLASSSTGSQLMKVGAFGGLILLQSFPLFHLLLEPGRGVYFHFPPYYPKVMALVGQGAEKEFYSGYGLMADVPAGFAWYSEQRVWSQPDKYEDFVRIVEQQNIASLYLSPQTLNRSIFKELAEVEASLESDSTDWTLGWNAVYAGLIRDEMPAFFPLQKSLRIADNAYLLMDKGAKRGR